MSDLDWGFSDAGTKLTSHTFLKIPYSLSFQIHCHLYHQLKQIALCSPDRLKKKSYTDIEPNSSEVRSQDSFKTHFSPFPLQNTLFN